MLFVRWSLSSVIRCELNWCCRAKERREKEKLIQEDHKERRIKTVMSLKR